MELKMDRRTLILAGIALGLVGALFPGWARADWDPGVNWDTVKAQSVPDAGTAVAGKPALPDFDLDLAELDPSRWELSGGIGNKDSAVLKLTDFDSLRRELKTWPESYIHLQIGCGPGRQNVSVQIYKMSKTGEEHSGSGPVYAPVAQGAVRDVKPEEVAKVKSILEGLLKRYERSHEMFDTTACRWARKILERLTQPSAPAASRD